MPSSAGGPRDASGSRPDGGRPYPRNCRILRSSEFRKVYSRGLKLSAPSLVVFLLENDRGGPRLGVTVTRRVGHAVCRNTMKRRIREIFRLNRPAIPQGWDIVVNVKPGAQSVSSSMVEREFLGALRRAAERSSK